VLKQVLVASYERNLFLVEVMLAIIIPLTLLSFRKIRTTANGLYISAVSVLLGFVANRLNVSITGMETAAGQHYVPKWTEIGITAAIVAAGFAIFALGAKYLPIFEEEHGHQTSPKPVEDSALARAAAMSNAD
jgi:Ni/Fe-hydrogenase subunit HybB-like protein